MPIWIFALSFVVVNVVFFFVVQSKSTLPTPVKTTPRLHFRWFIFLDQKIAFTLIQLAHCLPKHSAHPTVVSMINSSCGISFPTSSNLFLFRIFSVIFKNKFNSFFFFFFFNQKGTSYTWSLLLALSISVILARLNRPRKEIHACIASSFWEYLCFHKCSTFIIPYKC